MENVDRLFMKEVASLVFGEARVKEAINSVTRPKGWSAVIPTDSDSQYGQDFFQRLIKFNGPDGLEGRGFLKVVFNVTEYKIKTIIVLPSKNDKDSSFTKVNGVLEGLVVDLNVEIKRRLKLALES